MKPVWQEVTSSRRDDQGRAYLTYQLDIPSGDFPLRITITNGHVDYTGKWIVHCYPLNMDTVLLNGSKTLDDAQKEALGRVKIRITNWYTSLEQL